MDRSGGRARPRASVGEAHGDGRRGRMRSSAPGSEKEGATGEKARAIPRRNLSRRQWQPFFLTLPLLRLVALIAVRSARRDLEGDRDRTVKGRRSRRGPRYCCAQRDNSGSRDNDKRIFRRQWYGVARGDECVCKRSRGSSGAPIVVGRASGQPKRRSRRRREGCYRRQQRRRR